MTDVVAAERLDRASVQQALLESGAAAMGSELLTMAYRPIGIGHSADSFLVNLTWSAGSIAPVSLVAKVPSIDSASLGTAASLGLYERECRFYQELAPRTGVRTPKLLGLLADDGTSTGLLLEDLTGIAIPGVQLQDASLEQFHMAREQLVLLQAPLWADERVADLPWLHRRLGVPIPAISERLARSWNASKDGVCAHLSASEREVIDRFAANSSQWSESLSGPFSLVHHDFRFDNLMFSESQVYVLDWQTVGWGAPMFDFAYLLGTSFSRDRRMEVAHDEIHRHVDALAAAGVQGFTFDDAWMAYRQASFAVLLMLVPAMASVKRSDRGDAMFARLVQFGAQQVLDVDGLEFLPGSM